MLYEFLCIYSLDSDNINYMQAILQINLTGKQLVLIIIFILLLSGWIYLKNQYDERKQLGQQLVDQLTLEAKYDDPPAGKTIGYISGIVSGSDNYSNIYNGTEIEILYTASNSVGNERNELNKTFIVGSEVRMPLTIPIQGIDTDRIYHQYGNYPQVYMKVTFRYKATNFLSLFWGDSTNSIEKPPFILKLTH